MSAQIVNYKQNGMLTPDMAQLVDDIDAVGIPYFKILPIDVYYYLIQSPNSMYIFSVENNNLRAELNRNAVASLLRCAACPGAKGLTGAIGNDGQAGDPGPAEQFYIPSVDGNILSLVVENFEAPLDTEISLRLANSSSGDSAEIWLDSSGEWVVKNTSVNISDDSEISFGGKEFKASIISSSEWGTGWLAKIRQRGPDGWAGAAGEPFISIQESQLYALESTKSVASIRKSREYNLYYIQQQLGETSITSLRPYGGAQAGDACSIITVISYDSTSTADKIAAVNPVVSSKEIRRWVFEPVLNEFDDVSLPTWVPDPSCQGGVQYKWWSQFDNTTNEMPVQIDVAPEIDQKCCQEDYFFCPTLGTGGCEIESGGGWQWPPDSPPTGQDPNWEVYGKPPKWLPL